MLPSKNFSSMHVVDTTADFAREFCKSQDCVMYYTLFHQMSSMFFLNIIGLPKLRNKSVLENNKNVLFFNLNDKIIQQEMIKMAIHTHDIFRPRNTMFFLSNT